MQQHYRESIGDYLIKIGIESGEETDWEYWYYEGYNECYEFATCIEN